MDFMRYAKWVAISTLILALLSIPLIVIHIPVSLDGTVYDNGPSGFTLLLDALRSAGHRVVLGLPSPNDTGGGVILLILDPRFCVGFSGPSSDYISMLRSWIEGGAKVLQVVIVGESPCAYYFLKAVYPGVGGASSVNYVSFTLNGVRVVEPTGLVVDVGGSPTPLILYPPGAINPQLVFIGGSDFLRNSAVAKHPEYLKAFVSLLLPQATVVVYTLPETGDAGIAVSPYLLASALLYYLAMLERHLYSVSPILLALPYTLVAAALVYRLIGRGLVSREEPVYYRPSPPGLIGVTSVYARLVSSKKIAMSEAVIIIDRLYDIVDAALRYYLKAGIEDVLKSRDLLAKLASLTGWSPERVYRLLLRLYRVRRKIRGLAIRPIIFRWHKEATRLTSEASQLLKNLGVELDKIRGLEVLLEHGELRAREEVG